LLCPVREHCRAYEKGVQAELPIKSKKKKQTVKQMAAIVLRNDLGEVLIEKRPQTGLLARLWQFPNMEVTNVNGQSKELTKFLSEEFKLDAEVGEAIQHVEHVFSHLVWNITVFRGHVKGRPTLESETRKWVSQSEIETYAFPVSHQKIIQQSLMIHT